MILAKLELINFRNYRKQQVDFSPEKNIIIGKNAQGKSNLLEAIYLLSHLKSYRAQRMRELVLDGEEMASVRGLIIDGEVRLNAHVSFSNRGREVAIKGKEVESGKKARGFVKCVMFSPEDLYMVKGEPARRREFMDETMEGLGPIPASNLSHYKRVLGQRNALLRSWEESGDRLGAVLEPWNEALVKAGAGIVMARMRMVKEMEAQIRRDYSEIAGGQTEIDIKYRGTFGSQAGPAEEIESAMREALGGSINEEKRARTTVIGPHRDDVEIRVGGREARYSASQGEQRVLSFCMRLAQKAHLENETHKAPILLLDDVLSELDADRRRGVLEVAGRGNQAIITTTEIQDDLAGSGGEVFQVEQGKVTHV